MTFRRFMELALYHPEHGYYASGRARIGRRGDFFTNVSVGPLFGRLLARQFAEMWQRLGTPDTFTLIEQGAHGGDFLADALGGLREMAPDCFRVVRCRIVEPIERAVVIQRERLAEFAGKVDWARTLAEARAETAVHFSNELLDAFPVHRVKRSVHGWIEQNVVENGGRFEFADGSPVDGALAAACATLPDGLPAGFTTEMNLAARTWIGEAAACVERGYLLLVDYGHRRDEYYAPFRTGGTLSAYAAHRRELDPLTRPGALDLTAHVDFDALIEAACGAGLRLEGFTDQHHFMVGLGAAHFEGGANAGERRAFQTLMHPSFMGTAFKVAAFSKGIAKSAPLAGFQFARGMQPAATFPPESGRPSS